MNDLLSFLTGFGFNLLGTLIIVRFIYYPSNRDKRYVFTFLAFNTIIFFVVSLMASLEIGIGVGFGLFAIFSILRYRTDPIPVREMTYMFVIAAMPVMNSAALTGNHWPQIIAANLAIILILLILEKGWGFRYETSKNIIYEKIELIHPRRRAELMEDLASRTGMRINRINIGKINFLRDTVEIRVFFDEQRGADWQTTNLLEIVDEAIDDDD